MNDRRTSRLKELDAKRRLARESLTEWEWKELILLVVGTAAKGKVALESLYEYASTDGRVVNLLFGYAQHLQCLGLVKMIEINGGQVFHLGGGAVALSPKGRRLIEQHPGPLGEEIARRTEQSRELDLLHLLKPHRTNSQVLYRAYFPDDDPAVIKMVDRGLISMSPQKNGNGYWYELTPAGRQFLEELEARP